MHRTGWRGMRYGYFSSLRLARALYALVIVFITLHVCAGKTIIIMLILLRITLHRYVIANDISPAATEAMRRNIELNKLGPAPAPLPATGDAPPDGGKLRRPDLGKVRVSEMDAV